MTAAVRRSAGRLRDPFHDFRRGVRSAVSLSDIACDGEIGLFLYRALALLRGLGPLVPHLPVQMSRSPTRWARLCAP